MLSFLVLCVCLAISAFYEFIEWWTAFCLDRGGSISGHQGDIWDTQWDMFLALVAQSAALLTLSKLHDKQLQQVGRSGHNPLHRSI